MANHRAVGSIRSGAILTGDGWVDGTITIEAHSIASISDGSPTTDSAYNATGLLVLPGLIDLQVNGGWGIDLSQAPDALWKLSQRMPEVGVTAWLPTLISSEEADRNGALAALSQPVDGGAVPLGWHFEGPWISPRRPGAHDQSLIAPVPASLPAKHRRNGGLALVTLAPELPGAIDLISELTAAGVVVSCGHTDASAETVRLAIEAGATMGTHLFNAMSGLHHRNPGTAGELLHGDAFFGLIVDGIHVVPEIVELAWRLGSDRCVLVSDSMAGLGLEAGSSILGKSNVVLDGTSARLSDGTLAGSVISLRDAVRNLVAFTGCTLAEAVAAATARPAAVLGDQTRGVIAKGMRADFAIVDDNLNVVATVVGGDVVFASHDGAARMS